MAKEITLDQWQGESGIEVFMTENKDGFILIEYRKDKRTGEVKEKRHFVPLERVIALWDIITENIDVTPEAFRNNGFKFPYTALRKQYCLYYKDFATLLIVEYDLDIQDSKTFFGSRGSAYFPLYYYPMKVLESYKAVDYHRRTCRLVESLDDCLPL